LHGYFRGGGSFGLFVVTLLFVCTFSPPFYVVDRTSTFRALYLSAFRYRWWDALAGGFTFVWGIREISKVITYSTRSPAEPSCHEGEGGSARVIGLFVRHKFGSVYKVVPALFGYEWIQMLQSQMMCAMYVFW
jgi:hypothetical protein